MKFEHDRSIEVRLLFPRSQARDGRKVLSTSVSIFLVIIFLSEAVLSQDGSGGTPGRNHHCVVQANGYTVSLDDGRVSVMTPTGYFYENAHYRSFLQTEAIAHIGVAYRDIDGQPNLFIAVLDTTETCKAYLLLVLSPDEEKVGVYFSPNPGRKVDSSELALCREKQRHRR